MTCTAKHHAANEARLKMCLESEAAMRVELEAKGLTEEQIERGLGPIRSYSLGVEEEMAAYEEGK